MTPGTDIAPVTATATATATAIVVVNYASRALLEENLGSMNLAKTAWRVIIVDNFSTASERAAIALLCTARGWTLVTSANDGFGSGVNRGVSAARGAGCLTVVILNPDLRASTTVLSRLAAVAASEPLTLHCPTILRPDATVWFSGGEVLLAEGRTSTAPGSRASSATGWLSGACLAFSLELFDRVGGLDESYFMYWEDVDFSFRCRRAGAQLRLHADLCVEHDVGGTQNSRGKSPLYVYYNCRNRLIFAAKHLDSATRRRWLLASLPYARRVLLRGGRREFLRAALPLVWASLRGTVSGGRGV
ncbi:MAG: glycosyltransferase family 2 protein [Microbacteriaceae bacterium]|nr:glycosyltransferase family 2 protein [Microbacteriaceae bacterium]